jgi:hypothetical protein
MAKNGSIALAPPEMARAAFMTAMFQPNWPK